MSSISIIGSGNMASAIGALALKGGNVVEIMGRDAAKAAALALALGDGATAGTWAAAPGGDIVILAVLYESAVPVVTRVRRRARRQDHRRHHQPLQRQRHRAGNP